MTPEERDTIMFTCLQHYQRTLAVLRYVAQSDTTVTTPMLINAGLMHGRDVNAVRAVCALLGWALLYPCGKTQRWWLTPAGRDKCSQPLTVSTHSHSQSR